MIEVKLKGWKLLEISFKQIKFIDTVFYEKSRSFIKF